jgi:hypothetical protein
MSGGKCYKCPSFYHHEGPAADRELTKRLFLLLPNEALKS